MPQLSIVTVYPRDGGVGISITETRAKFKNLLRDPRCSVLVSHVDWWSGFLVFEGKAELIALRQHRPRSAASGSPPHLQRHHAAAQRGLGCSTTGSRQADKRVAMVVRPDHIYGSALAKMRDAVTK